MMKEVLICTASGDKFASVRALGDRLGFRVTRLDRTGFDTPLCKLLGLPVSLPGPEDLRPAPILYNAPELMVLHGFGSEDLDAFLKTYREQGIAPIPLKAVTTLHNLGWTPYYLAEHLREEAERFSRS